MKKSKIEWLARFFISVCVGALSIYLIGDLFIFIGAFLLILAKDFVGGCGE